MQPFGAHVDLFPDHTVRKILTPFLMSLDICQGKQMDKQQEDAVDTELPQRDKYL